jgi:hypothetical protein
MFDPERMARVDAKRSRFRQESRMAKKNIISSLLDEIEDDQKDIDDEKDTEDNYRGGS